MRNYHNRRKGIGCLPAMALSFALGVILALCCSYGTILVILSLFLIGMIVYCCF